MSARNDLIHKILVFVFKIIGRELTEKTERSFRQFLRFCIVGVTNTGVSYATYALCLFLFKQFGVAMGYNYYIAQMIAFFVSGVWAFCWSNRLVFKKSENGKRNPILALLKTLLTYGFTGLILSNALLYLWVDVLGIVDYVAPLLSLCFTFPLNFILNKFWAFREKKQGTPAEAADADIAKQE